MHGELLKLGFEGRAVECRQMHGEATRAAANTTAASAPRLSVHTGSRKLAELLCCIAIGEISHAAATNFNQKI
jgi:hypothetical protein